MSQYNKQNRKQISSLYKLKFTYKGINILKPRNYICSENECEFDTNGYPNYFDNSHLTRTGANRLRPMYQKIFVDFTEKYSVE